MTDGGIGTAKGDFDHEDVEGQADSFVGEAPATEIFISGAGFNSDKGVRRSRGISEESDALEFGNGSGVEIKGREEGRLPEGDEHEEDLIVT
jgi:hypothetical protein